MAFQLVSKKHRLQAAAVRNGDHDQRRSKVSEASAAARHEQVASGTLPRSVNERWPSERELQGIDRSVDCVSREAQLCEIKCKQCFISKSDGSNPDPVFANDVAH